jgi:tetratricopeptide (TPR) repeat protein
VTTDATTGQHRALIRRPPNEGYPMPGPPPLTVRLADLALAVVLLAAPHLVGTVHPGSWLLAFAGSFVALALLLFMRREASIPRWAQVTSLAAGIALLAPLVPLPPGLLAALSPVAAETWSLPPLDGAAWRPLHQAPGEGLFELLRALTAIAFLLACTLRADDAKWRAMTVRLIVLAVVLAGLSALIHTAAGMETVSGFYEVQWDRRKTWLAPLVNENHWTAYLSLGILVAAGLFVRSRRSIAALPYGVAVVGLSTLVLVNRSRVGIVGLAAGTVALVLLFLITRNGVEGRTRLAAISSAAVAVLVSGAVTLWLVAERSRLRVDRYSGEESRGLADNMRLHLMPDAWQTTLAHPWTGVGRGAGVDVLPRFREIEGTFRTRWLESLLPQFLLDHGLVLGGLLALLVVGLVLATVLAARRDAAIAGPSAALLALLVHEMADFSTQTGAVLLTSIALLAIALGSLAHPAEPDDDEDDDDGFDEEEDDTLDDEVRPRRRRGVVGSALILLALLAGFALVVPGLSHWESGRCIRELDRAADDGVVDWEAAGLEEARWHPAAFHVALTVGVGQMRAGQGEQAMLWLNRAQVLAPKHPWPHLHTARLLRLVGARDQALTEYRLSAEGDWERQARSVLFEVAAGWEEVEAVERLVSPDRPEAAAEFALWLIEQGDERRGLHLARRAWRDAPEHASSPVGASLVAVREGRIEDAQAIVREAWTRPDMPPYLKAQLARRMGQAGAPDEQYRMLRELVTVENPGPEPWLMLAELEVERGDSSSARVALRRVRAYGWSKPTARAFRAESRLLRDEGRTMAALQYAQRAVETDSGQVESHLLAAELLIEGGRNAEADASLDRALQLDPGNPRALRLRTSMESRPGRPAPAEPTPSEPTPSETAPSEPTPTPGPDSGAVGAGG